MTGQVHINITPPKISVLHDCKISRSKRTSGVDGTERVRDVLRTVSSADNLETPPRDIDQFIYVACPGESNRIYELKDIDNNATMAQLARGRVDAKVGFIRAHKDEGAETRAWYTMSGIKW